MVKVIKPEEMKVISAGDSHSGVKLKVLIDKEVGAKNVGVSMGEIAPGGIVEPHRHEDMEHCYYIVKGELTIISDLGRSYLTEGMLFWIGINELHGMANESNTNATYLAIAAPPPVMNIPDTDE